MSSSLKISLPVLAMVMMTSHAVTAGKPPSSALRAGNRTRIRRYVLPMYLPTQTCCYNSDCSDYFGDLQTTKSGETCQDWKEDFPQKRWKKVAERSEGLKMNYCRNPFKSAEGAWCYTMNWGKRWESCDIPRCSDEDWNNEDGRLLQRAGIIRKPGLRESEEVEKMDDKANKKDEVNKMDNKANKKDEVNKMDDDETIRRQAAETGRRDDITVEKMDDEASKMDQANTMDKANKMDNDKTIQRLAADRPEVGRMRRSVLKGKGGL